MIHWKKRKQQRRHVLLFSGIYCCTSAFQKNSYPVVKSYRSIQIQTEISKFGSMLFSLDRRGDWKVAQAVRRMQWSEKYDICKSTRTQMSSWVMTTSPSWQAAWRAVRGAEVDPAGGALIWSLVLWARRSSSLGRSLSVTADSSHTGIPSSGGVWRAATNARWSYLARIHDSLSSLVRQTQKRDPVIYRNTQDFKNRKLWCLRIWATNLEGFLSQTTDALTFVHIMRRLLYWRFCSNLHVYDLTFISRGGGDGGEVQQQRCQASDRSSRQRFDICKCYTTGYLKGDLGTFSIRVFATETSSWSSPDETRRCTMQIKTEHKETCNCKTKKCKSPTYQWLPEIFPTIILVKSLAYKQ